MSWYFTEGRQRFFTNTTTGFLLSLARNVTKGKSADRSRRPFVVWPKATVGLHLVLAASFAHIILHATISHAILLGAVLNLGMHGGAKGSGAPQGNSNAVKLAASRRNQLSVERCCATKLGKHGIY